MPDPVLGIDPSIRATGFAWRFQDATNWRTRVCRGDDAVSLMNFIAWASRENARKAYIEDAGPMRLNPKVASQLDQLRGRIQAWCLKADMEYVMVSPTEWQSAMLGKTVKGGTKPASILMASELGADVTRALKSGSRVLDDNLADAVCLSEYGRLQEALSGIEQEAE